MKDTPKFDRKSAEEARRTLPAILDAAAKGRVTVITRHGVAVAAVVPAKAAGANPVSLLTLAGSGKGLWAPRSGAAVAGLRKEWSR